MKQELDIYQTAARLRNEGVPLEVISSSLDVPMSMLVKHLSTSTTLSPEDQQLAQGMRQLAWKAWGEAMWVLENGHPADKLALTRVVLGKVAGLIGQESTTTFEETQASVERIFSSMREGVKPQQLMESEEHDSEVENGVKLTGSPIAEDEGGGVVLGTAEDWGV